MNESVCPDRWAALSERERQVALGYASGESHRQLAERLCIAPSTVRTHLQSIYRKLEVGSKFALREALVTSGALPGATRATEAPDADRKPVILVEQFTGSGETSLAADLAAEFRSELVDALSHRTGSRVATRADRAPAPTYVLSGRFLVVGLACRASLEMIEVATGETFWTEKLDEEITNVLEFLDRTVERVNVALRAHFNTYAGAAFAARPDNELNIQQLLTKAAYFIYRFDAENAARSRAVMEAAFKRSPDSAIVVAMYSYTLVQTVPLAIDRVLDVDAERAIRLADRAVSLGPDIDFVFHNRAKLRLWIQRDHDGCREDAQRILQINPTYHIAREDQACADIFSGNRAAGIRMLESLVEEVPREPLSPFRKSIIAIGYALEGNMAAALQSARSGFEEKPFVPIHAIAYAAAVSQDRKLARSQRFRALMRERHIEIRDAERIPLSDANDMARLKRLLEKALA
jgi:adenylate cyclase